MSEFARIAGDLRGAAVGLALLWALGCGVDVASGGRDGARPPAFAVYTLSRGQGVPEPARRALGEIEMLLETARKGGTALRVASARIGLEGESRLCVELDDREAAERLLAQVRAAVRGVELVNVVEGPCPEL